MSDLARQVAEHLTRIVWGDFADPEEGVADVIRSHGTLVSREQAELLREVERIAAGGEFSLMKYSDGWMAGSPSRRTGRWEYAKRATPQAALHSALDAAGVPDASKMGEKA